MLNNTIYELNDEERMEIEAKLNALLQVCQIYKTPMFASVAIRNTDQETEYSNIVYSAQSHNLCLKNDCIRKYVLIADGFEPVPPREVISNDVFGVAEGVANDDRR